jgi:UDP-N-acetylglucosamine 2-epimerase
LHSPEAEQFAHATGLYGAYGGILQKKAPISGIRQAQDGREMLKAKGTVVVGYTAAEILKYAEPNQIDRLCFAPRRSGSTPGPGRVASKVIHALAFTVG